MKNSNPFSVNADGKTTSLFDAKPYDPASAKDWATSGAAQFRVRGTDSDDEDKLEEEKRERPTEASGSVKHFQCLVEKLYILKGVGTQCAQPCKKGDGYVSIEESGKTPLVVYRSLTGQTLFSGILNKSAAKIKDQE